MAIHWLTRIDTILSLTPEAVVCVLGEAFLLQSSEFVEDVEVGVIGTALLLLLPVMVANQVRTMCSLYEPNCIFEKLMIILTRT